VIDPVFLDTPLYRCQALEPGLGCAVRRFELDAHRDPCLLESIVSRPPLKPPMPSVTGREPTSSSLDDADFLGAGEDQEDQED